MKDLEIKLNDISYQDFYNLITIDIEGNWSHTPDKEEKGRLFGQTYICFEYDSSNFGRAGFTILKENENKLSVPNIVPLDKSQLSIKEYNQVLDIFVTDILERYKNNENFEYSLSNDILILKDEIDTESYNKYKAFVGIASGLGGISHPNDQRRWFDFIIATYNEDLDLNLLKCSLVEDGLNSDLSDRLIEKYDFGRDLLRRYSC